MSTNNAELPSNRKFGFFFSAVFAASCGYFYFNYGGMIVPVFAALTAATLALTLLAPNTLLPFNKLWFKFGLLLGKIISPIVLGIIFFILITPIAILMRLMGRDELRLKMQLRQSHWKERVPAGPQPQSFKNQH